MSLTRRIKGRIGRSLFYMRAICDIDAALFWLAQVFDSWTDTFNGYYWQSY
jgi:hypothetical protein